MTQAKDVNERPQLGDENFLCCVCVVVGGANCRGWSFSYWCERRNPTSQDQVFENLPIDK